MKLKFLGLIIVALLSSCTSRKDILYLQNADDQNENTVVYQNTTIQPNDILKITVESLMPLAALPYNKGAGQTVQQNSIELIKLDGYLVSSDYEINFPVLGAISLKSLSVRAAEAFIEKQLIDGGHLNDARVSVRVVNAKVSVLGEVAKPGTYTFTEQNITLLQALGYAGDLTINGERENVLVTREVDGVRHVAHLDLTSADFMDSEFYYVKPNDVIVINQNNPKVKSAGFVGNVGTVLTIFSLILSTTIILTR
ncbi:polysaccharide biosynthesis/export family protein [Lacinutrix undariae]